MDVTGRNITRNQATFDYERKVALLGDNSTRREDYANISGALETVEMYTVMGKVDATGKLVPCDSTAVDGSQVPVAIILDKLEDIAIAGTVDDVLTCNGGSFDKGKLVFQNGTDTLATRVTSQGGDERSMEDWLISSSKGFELVPVSDSSEFDN